MQLAIVYHNYATGYDVIPVKAGVYNTALNILLDNWPDIGAAAITRPVRDDLARRVAEAVDACPGLDDEQRGAYKGLLRSKVYQGTDSMHGRLLGLLQDLGAVDTSCDDATIRRVRHVNTARNSLTHSGAMPQFKGLDQGQSNELTVAIVECMVREINQLALCRMLGIDDGSVTVGPELRAFFTQGIWAGRQIEPADDSGP